MYAEFFGLRQDPFRATPDPAMLYLTADHREALAGISYAILMRRGFAALTGDVGTGKTTIMSRIMQMMPRNRTAFSVILNSALTRSEFLEAVMLDFGFEEIPSSKAQRLVKLQQFFIAQFTAGGTCVLIVDEAHRLQEEIFEEVQLLSNCELPDQKLLQIILSGQSELDVLLEKPSLRQLKRRLSVWLRLAPLAPHDVLEYLRFRWAKAGGAEPLPFDPGALTAIGEFSKGIPRVINVLCDNALLLAFGGGSRSVSSSHIEDAATALSLRRAAPKAVVDAPPQPLPPQALEGGAIPEMLSTLRRYGPAPATQSRISRWAARVVRRHAAGII